MKILVLMGSPRKKDSLRVCKLVEECIEEKAEITFDYVYLKELNIEDCRGCDLCFQKGEEYCPIKDDLNYLKQKLIEADGIIFASPVYAYGVTGSFKRVIERFSYLFHRPELIGKPALSLVTTGGGGQKQTTKYLKMTACGWGCNLVGSIEVISSMFFQEKGPFQFFNEKYFNKTNKKIITLSQNFIDAIISKKLLKPSFYDIYMFNGLRSKTVTSKADYKYWEAKGWLDSRYYYKTNIGPIKLLFGKLLKGIIDSVSKRMFRVQVEKE